MRKESMLNLYDKDINRTATPDNDDFDQIIEDKGLL